MSPQLPGPTLPSHQAFYGGSLDRESASTSARPTNTSPDSCANCSLSLPQGVSAQLPAGAPGSPRPDGSGKNGSPVLRTRDEYLVGRPSCNSSSVSSSASSTTSSPSNARRRSRSRTSVAPAIPTQLPSPPLDPSAYSLETVRPGLSPPLHRHSLNYITSRHPQSPASFSLLRSSCIRTLSCEQLPRATSGPLYFGNRASGSTLAYVFRIPDPKALGRGRKRSYALILLGVDERRTMAVSAWVLRRFEMMADWIVGMAEAASGETEALRPEPGLPDVEARYGDVNRIGGLQGSGIKGDGVSAFLSGRSGWDRGEGWGAGRQADVRARGLAELCGKEDVFVELHRQFVCLLVGILRGGGPGGLGDLGDDWDE
ncbi:MAG: hypothetical protein M1814_004111 [Vezdaea aestivalis]|nr:MAG: hypothetical protein M1814_004111 [Vezdaea aestivalis]